MRYFLTGATGFIGGRLAQQLRASGHEVVATVRNPAVADDLITLGVEVVEGDVTHPETLRAPMAGCDGVFHVAGWYKIGGRSTDDGVKVNIEGTRNVLQVMKELEIPRGVYTSTLAVNSNTHGRLVDETYRFEGEHLTEYDRTKAEAHRVADAFIEDGLPLVIVQPGVVYGPGDTSAAQKTLVQYLMGDMPMIPERTAYCWAHVDDTAAGHLLAMEKGTPGESYFLSGPAHTLVQVLELAEHITGIPAPKRRASPALLQFLAKAMSAVERVFPVPEGYSSELLRTLAGATYIGDNRKARQELGYAPRPLEEGLRETLRCECAALGIPSTF